MTSQHADLSRAVWRKSSFSGSNGGQCVEVAPARPGLVAVRDSTAPQGPNLVVAAPEWAAFVRRLAGGRPGR